MVQKWMQHSRHGFTSAEYKGIITALVLLATRFLIQTWFLIQASSPLTSWPPGHTLDHVQPAAEKHCRSFSSEYLSRNSAPACSVSWVVMSQVQDLTLHLIEPLEIGFSPLIQIVQIPLQSLHSLLQINTPTVWEARLKDYWFKTTEMFGGEEEDTHTQMYAHTLMLQLFLPRNPFLQSLTWCWWQTYWGGIPSPHSDHS